jgi:hypothetical protein
MADDTDAGLPVRQLLKMVASGDLSPAEFKQLTKHVIGCDEEVPIDVTGDDTEEREEPAQPTAAAPSPATAAQTPTAPADANNEGAETNESDNDESDDDESDDEGAESAAAAGPLPWDEGEAEAEAEDKEDTPAMKKQKAFKDGNLLAFVTKHAPPLAKVAAQRKPGAYTPKKTISESPARQVGRGSSTHKNGARENDVQPKTMHRRIKEHPGQGLKIVAGQLWCDPCGCNVGSSKQDCYKHVNNTQKHKDAMVALSASNENHAAIQAAIHDWTQQVKETHGEGVEIKGLTRVPEQTQLARAEALEEVLKAGIPAAKIDKLRPYLERRMGISLTQSNHLCTTYIPALKIKEEKILRNEFKGELIGVYHDGTTHQGESFAIVFRACLPGFVFRICCVRLRFLRGSMTADQISSELIECIASHMQAASSLRT